LAQANLGSLALNYGFYIPFASLPSVSHLSSAMPSAEKLAKKTAYFNKLIDLCIESPQALIVGIEHVTSKQLQQIRIELRGSAVVLMGKNTMIRKALAVGHERRPELGFDKLRAAIVGNLGFIFATNCTVDDIRAVIDSHRRQAAAKAGQVSMCNLSLPAGPTGMDPSQTSFFQALNIGTKIVKGQIELVTDFPILRMGEKVPASSAILLGKLNIKPFEYGMEILQVFQDGSVFPASVLEMSNDVLIQKFMQGVAHMAAFSRELGIPSEAALPHMFGNAFRNIAALVAEIDFTFQEVEAVKQFLADPDAFRAANPVGASGASPAAESSAMGTAKAVIEEEEEEEEMDFDLFG